MLFKRLLTGFLVTVFFSTSYASEWKLEKSDDELGISVYTRDVSGSEFKEYKGVTEMKSSLSGVVALLKDSSNLPNWIHNMVEQKILKRKAGRSLAYSVTKGNDSESRDNIIMSSFKQSLDTSVITINMKGKPDHLPKKENYTRIESLNGSWTISPKGNGNVEVIYQLHVEPGGDFASKMYNDVAVIESPLGTLSGMHMQIEKYQNQKLDFVSE